MSVNCIQVPPSVTTLTYMNHCGDKPKIPETLPASLADCLSETDYTELFLKPVKEAAKNYKFRGENAAAWITFALFPVAVFFSGMYVVLFFNHPHPFLWFLYFIPALLLFFFSVLFAARDSEFKLFYIKMESICFNISDSLAHKGVMVRSRAIDSSNMAQVVFDFIRIAPPAPRSDSGDQGSTTTVSE